jgi:hypothetical protein
VRLAVYDSDESFPIGYIELQFVGRMRDRDLSKCVLVPEVQEFDGGQRVKSFKMIEGDIDASR